MGLEDPADVLVGAAVDSGEDRQLVLTIMILLQGMSYGPLLSAVAFLKGPKVWVPILKVVCNGALTGS